MELVKIKNLLCIAFYIFLLNYDINAQNAMHLKIREPVIAQEDSVVIISNEEIKKAMQFGTPEKVISIAMGSFLGFFIGSSIGAVIVSGHEGLDVLPGVVLNIIF